MTIPEFVIFTLCIKMFFGEIWNVIETPCFTEKTCVSSHRNRAKREQVSGTPIILFHQNCKGKSYLAENAWSGEMRPGAAIHTHKLRL